MNRAYGTRAGVVDLVNGLKPVATRWVEPTALFDTQNFAEKFVKSKWLDLKLVLTVMLLTA
jgi:hypothetical protein